MKSSRYAFPILAFFSFSAAVFGQEPSTGEDSRLRVAIEAGAQTRQTEGEKTFGFQMHRDIPQGAFLRTLDFIWLREGSPWRFSFHSTDLTQRDQRFTASLERPFAHKLDFRWDGFARYWSNHNPSILQEVSRGRFTAPAALRSSLENTTDNATLEALVRDAVGSSGQVEIRSFRERSTLTYAYSIVEGLTLRLSVMNERRRGNRLFAEGTYNRISTPTGDTFETPGQELFEPTHYQTNELGAELNYARQQWLVGFEYRASLFDNSDLALVWQNPFRLTHAQATPPAGALNRGRFAATQTALAPDNQAHTVSVNGLVLLPLASKGSGRVSWARWTQDEPFLPFTINTAITASNLGELSPTALEALPKASLEGLIHTLNQDYAATSRPARWLQLTARYNDYDLDNLTEEIHFPGFATYGDSFWRTSISGQPGTTPVPIQNEPKSFRRQRAELQTAVRPLDAWTWKSTYRYERYTREGRQVPRSDEHGLLTSISYAPNRVVFGQAGFRYFDRTPETYDSGTLEPSFLRMFDQAQRLRKQGDAVFSIQWSPSTLLSGSWFYLADTYDKNFSGLHQQKTYAVSVDMSWNGPKSLGVVTGWSYDRTGYDYSTVAKTAEPYNFLNTWARDTREGVHSAHVGLSGAVADGKGQYQLSYAMSLARTAIATANPSTIVPTNALNAQAYPFPIVRNQFHEVRADASYRLREGFRVGVYVLLEPYRLNDFAVDVISPYDPGALAPEIDARRYIFLNVQPSNYFGALAAVYVRYDFR